MARMWSSGFELNSILTEFDGTDGTPTLQTSVVRSGIYAMKVNLTGANVHHVSFNHGGGGNQSAAAIRFYFYCETLPNATTTVFRMDGFSGGTPHRVVQIKMKTTGELQLFTGISTQIGSDSDPLDTGRWYRIEMYYDDGPSDGSEILHAYIDGTEFAGSNALNYSNAGQTVYFGANLLVGISGGVETGATSGTFYFDDIAINDNTTLPGSGRILHIKPNSTGDNNAWSTSGSSTNYENVDETTPNDATDYNLSNTLNQIDDFNVESTGLDEDTNTISLVQVGFRANGAGASSNATFVLRVKASASGTVSESSGLAPVNTNWRTNSVNTTDVHSYRLTSTTQPGTASAWTPAVLENAQIGYRVSASSTNASNISTVWLLVEYIGPNPRTQSGSEETAEGIGASDWGIKVSKDGYDVTTTGVINQLFNSQYASFQLRATGREQFVFTQATNTTQTFTIPHNLGYVPYFLVRVVFAPDETSSSAIPTFLVPFSSSFTGSDGTSIQFINAIADETNIKVLIKVLRLSGTALTSNLTFYAYYSIFSESISGTAPVDPSGDVGLKFSKPGENVISATDDKLGYSSRYKSLQVFYEYPESTTSIGDLSLLPNQIWSEGMPGTLAFFKSGGEWRFEGNKTNLFPTLTTDEAMPLSINSRMRSATGLQGSQTDLRARLSRSGSAPDKTKVFVINNKASDLGVL